MSPKIKLAKWRNGVLAPALITFDDLCPEYSKEYDCGGNMTKNGVIEKLVIGQIHKNFPQAKFFFFTIPNVRYKWISFYQFEVVPKDTYLLSRYPNWVDWVNEKVKNNNFYIGYHGWEHCHPKGTEGPAGQRLEHRYSAEFIDRTEKDTIDRLKKMMDEFNKVGLIHEKVFVAPCGKNNPALYEFLAEEDIFLAFHYEGDKKKGRGYPEYVTLLNGNKLLCLARQSAWIPDDPGKGFITEIIDGKVAKGEPLIFDNHFCNNSGVRNGISEHSVERLKNVLKYVTETYRENVKFLSYGEMRQDLEAIEAIRYRIVIESGKVIIKTKNNIQELKGITWEIPRNMKKIEILTRDRERVPFRKKIINDKFLVIIDIS